MKSKLLYRIHQTVKDSGSLRFYYPRRTDNGKNKGELRYKKIFKAELKI